MKTLTEEQVREKFKHSIELYRKKIQQVFEAILKVESKSDSYSQPNHELTLTRQVS